MRISDWSSDVCSSDLSSLVTFWPSERCTTAGPAAKIWLVLSTITDQCDRMARPAGPPAADPMTAETTGTWARSSTERSKMSTPGKTVWPRRFAEATEPPAPSIRLRSEEHTSELQSLMRISYAVFCLKKKSPTIVQYT